MTRTEISARQEVLRELLIAEHSLQQALIDAGLHHPTPSYKPRFMRILGESDSSRRRALRKLRNSFANSEGFVPHLYRAIQWRLARLMRRLRRRGTGSPRNFTTSQIRIRERQANEYGLLAFPNIAEFKGTATSKRCFILGNGPSLAGTDLSRLRNETVFVTNWFANHPDIDTIRPNFYCVCSHELFGGWGREIPHFNDDLRKRIEELNHPLSLILPYRFMPYVESGGLFSQHDRRYLLFDRPKAGIDQVGQIELDLSRPLHDGYTVIITFCLPLAKWMGFEEIYLLGVDSNYGISQPSDPKQYFYDSELHTSSTSKFESLNRIWQPGGPVFQNYEIVRQQFAADGIRVVNLTPGGQLDVFERMTLDDVLREDV